MRGFIYLSALTALVLALTGCHPPLQREALRPEDALERVRFSLPFFQDDMDLASLDLAVERNLEYLRKLDPNDVFEYGKDRYTCRQVLNSQLAFLDLFRRSKDPAEFNEAIRKEFLFYRARGRAGYPTVLFTGYYEPTYEASLRPDEVYRYPIYKKPDDLIQVNLSLFRDEWKGKTIIARIDGKKVLPYFSRKQIDGGGVLAGRELELAWLKDPVDIAFLQIQGSGRLRLRGGDIMRVGYEVSNGRAYQSIGRYMIQKGMLGKKEMSMQAIRRYLELHPEVQEDVLNYNPSYVFFRTNLDGPYGNIRVPLTPGRSLALDSRLFPRGALVFIRSKKPVLDAEKEITTWTDFSRFVLNQDTGGAIKGAGRADLFWGDDSYAELAAGHMQHEGELYLLVKKP